ncbi:hypothetical protein A3Q56_08461, partial [Intoshia linei]
RKKKLTGTWSETFSSILGGITTFVGPSHPRSETGPALFARNAYSTSNSVEDMSIEAIGAIPTFYTWKTFSNTDKTLDLTVNLLISNNFAGSSVYTPGSASAMIAARVAIFATSSSTDFGMNYLKVTRTIDVQGDMLEEMDLPYFQKPAYAALGAKWKVQNNLIEKKSRNNKDNRQENKQIFLFIFDNVCQQINQRFEHFKEHRFISVSPIKNFNIVFQMDKLALNCLEHNYGQFFDVLRLKSDLVGIYNCKMLKSKSIKDLLTFIFENDLNSTFCETVTVNIDHSSNNCFGEKIFFHFKANKIFQ